MLRSVWLLAEVLACSFLSEPGTGAALPLNSKAKTSSFMTDLLRRGRFRERLEDRDWSLRTVIGGVKDVRVDHHRLGGRPHPSFLQSRLTTSPRDLSLPGGCVSATCSPKLVRKSQDNRDLRLFRDLPRKTRPFRG